MKKTKILKIVVGVGLSAVLLMGCGSKNNTKTTAENQTQETTAEEKTVKLDKDNAINVSYEKDKDDDYKTIYDSFKNQEIKAKEKYLNKTLKISGEIEDIEKKDGYIIVSIMSKTCFYADLYFKDNEENEAKIGTLKKWDKTSGASSSGKGDVITAYGIFEEFAKSANGNYYIKVINCEFI